MGEQGHRTLPHTADLRVQAWAPTREECVAEAVRAVADSVGTPGPAAPTHPVELHATGRSDADLLVRVLDEVVYLLDTTGEVPGGVEVGAVPDGLRVRFAMAPLPPDRAVGAAPKAVTLHGLEFAGRDGHWQCTVTLDV